MSIFEVDFEVPIHFVSLPTNQDLAINFLSGTEFIHEVFSPVMLLNYLISSVRNTIVCSTGAVTF